MYSYVDQKHWEEFVRLRLCQTFQERRNIQQEHQAKNKYNHQMSRKGYANLCEEMKKVSSSEGDFDRANVWNRLE